MAKKTMTASHMTDGQIENIVAKFRDALRTKREKFGSKAVQQVLGIDNLGMRLLEPFRKLVETISDLIVRTVKVDRSLIGKAALDATGRKHYTDDEVVATMPQGESEKTELVFFKPDRYVNNDDEVDKEHELRGTVPADPHELAAFNAANPEFADDHPNGTHWKDVNGKWCYIAFHCWNDEPSVNVYRYDFKWNGRWWFAGRRK